MLEVKSTGALNPPIVTDVSSGALAKSLPRIEAIAPGLMIGEWDAPFTTAEIVGV